VGTSNYGVGVYGESRGEPWVQGSPPPTDGVFGLGMNGVHGVGFAGGHGVFGENSGGDAVVGLCTSTGRHAAVSATNDSGGFGVWARGTPGGHFESAGGTGVHGIGGLHGVLGESSGGDGVVGLCKSKGAGVSATNDSGGFGVWARGTPAGHFEGNVEVTGDVILTGSDCAEDFDITEAEVEPGTVMAIDQDGTLRSSTRPYDKRVAGVVSGAGQYRPGIILGRQQSRNAMMPVALMGKVYCKVDAGYSPIDVGDLLTTSPTPGHAMKADDHDKAFGAVIGKALRRLEAGQGLIPILVALQ